MSFLFVFSSNSFSQQAGTLNSGFGVSGKVTTYLNTIDVVVPYATAIQQDGKIVVAAGVGYQTTGDTAPPGP